MNLLPTLANALPGMPPESWWLVPVALVLLGTLAVIDALTSKIPDPIILPSLLAVTGIEGYYVNWPFAGRSLLIALAAGFVIYLANEIWFRFAHRDALGMGDAKWTIVAVSVFGCTPSVFAWIVGAWLAIGWMGIMKIIKRPIARVHFAPFLFVGLLAGIYWLKLR